MRCLRCFASTGLLFLVCTAAPVVGEAHAGAGVEVLDTYSHWRCHVTVRPIPFGTQKDSKPHERGTHAIGFKIRRKPTIPLDGPVTPFPPADWMKPEFDDARWWRDPGPFFGGAAYVGGHRSLPHMNRYGVEQASLIYLLCVRGKFNVENPAAVRSLKLSAEFRGGLRVWLNGEEVARRHLPAGEIGLETLADDYPLEASLKKDGKLYNVWQGKKRDEGVGLRVRTLTGLDLPVQRLRKGVNVLALEIHRAALPMEMTKLGRRVRGTVDTTGVFWNSVGLVKVELTAAGGGAKANAGRPEDVQIWNANPMESVYSSDWGDPTEPLRPIRIEGARNGAFAGQVLVGSRAAIRGLAAEATELKRKDGGGVIPASALQVRYPRATLSEVGAKYAHPPRGGGRKAAVPMRFHDLAESPPTEVPALVVPGGASGATQPVWLTVEVPADAAAGEYEGILTVKPGGAAAVKVPVHLVVHDFRLPDPENLQTWVDFVQSPENLAEQYKVPMWSEKHWTLIERSMRFLTQVKNKTLYMPLICRCNLGNSQSMIRWTKKNGGYAPDFSIIERYLDTALKAGLKPEIVAFQVWDYHIGLNYDRKFRIGTGMYGQPTALKKGQKDPGLQPVPFSLLDAGSGKVKEMPGPAYDDPKAEAFWRPVAEGLKERLQKRDLEKAMMLGLIPDFIPKKEVVEFWSKLLPGVPWVTMGHGLAPMKDGQRVLYDAPVGYSTTVFGVHFAMDPEIERQLGWKCTERVAYFSRFPGGARLMQLAGDRTLFEKGLTAGTRGAGRLGLDFFAFRSKDKWGKNALESGGYPSWGSLTMGPPWLAPGPEGPVSTTRFEMAREAIQECEARILLEQALDDPAKKGKLGDALAKKCRAILDERTRYLIWAQEKHTNRAPHTSMPGGPIGFDWYAGSDWQGRSAKLYAAAAEVAKALGLK